jgi:two-component system chemotaxis sensor kinase CheA
LLEIEKAPDGDLLKLLLRQAHTLKGASRVVKRTDIGDLAHTLEDLLSPHRDHGGAIEPGTIDGALQLVEQIRQLVASLDSARDVSTEPHRKSASDRGQQTIRIAVEGLDALLEGTFEAQSAAASLRQHAAKSSALLSRLRSLSPDPLSKDSGSPTQQPGAHAEALVSELDTVHRDLLDGVDQVVAELRELHASISDLRLVPAQSLITDLEGAARDAARTLDRDVELVASGAETHIDAHVLAGLRQALVHVVRNSVAHGIEDRNERRSVGKPPVGRIKVAIERRRHRVSIRCRDDGRGLAFESIRQQAVKRRLVAPEQALALDQRALCELLLHGGLSTSRTLTGISGRGVGLDAVRHAVESLDGEISLKSTKGKGTLVEILVPLSLSSMPSLAMQVDDTAVLVPLDSIRQALRVSRKDIVRDEQGEHLVVGGEVLPFLPLARALEHPSLERHSMQSALVIEAEGRRAAIGIDRLGAARNVVMRSIPEHAAVSPIVSGAVLNEQGVPELMLAPRALVRAVADTSFADRGPATETVLPLLVIDDSLTTRMLEQSILESAGYRVDVAVSGEEALEKARIERYGLFIVDIEMPGMSGFDFIAQVRHDPELRDTPSILVTSRGDPEDKRRGKAVGARAYIVKSEFDQNRLLETIRRLLA